MDIRKWAKYLNDSTARGLHSAFEFVKSGVSSKDYNKILDLANKNEVN